MEAESDAEMEDAEDKEERAESGEDDGEDEDEDEDEADELEGATFAGFDAEELNAAEGVEEAEPSFNDKRLPAWKDVKLHATLKNGLVSLGFKKPTDIQRRAIPLALEGRDVVGVAETVSTGHYLVRS